MVSEGPAPAAPFPPPQPVNNADFIIPVEIDGVVHQVRDWVWGEAVGLASAFQTPGSYSPESSQMGL